MKILTLDIETAPHLGYIWSLWKENIPLARLLETGYVLSWSAKWLGEDYVFFDSIQHKKPRAMLRGIHKLLNEADAVIHYNGKKFDIPTLNAEFVRHGLLPPSPYKQIDLLETARAQFRFPSYKLEYVASELKVGEKVKHAGFELWVGCINKDPESWKQMEEYNVGDVIITEALYYKLRPWIKGHINYSLYSEDARVCPVCGSTHLNKRGYHYTLHSRFQRYRCMECGHWFKDNKVLNRQEYKTSSI